MKCADLPVSLTKTAPTSQIRRAAPKQNCDFKKCETTLNIGLFFDGTSNNRERDLPRLADSNISRLYETYRSDTITGYRSVYIPGVGTKFPEIGEHDESLLGAGCALGCEARVIFAILYVFNALHYRSFNQDLFGADDIAALCCNGNSVSSSKDREILEKLGMHTGLLQQNANKDGNRQDFLTRQSSFLEAKLKSGRPHVVECFIDVFGFSRGAAEARVFCHWLNELLVGDRLAGVPVRMRFVGIFDTVASAGFWSGATSALTNSTGGHGSWASAESLRIPASVENCVHMIAMHELRRNFPLDEIGSNGKLQTGWVQHAYPGAHSDVGGGYSPGDLGISVGYDSLKLAQIPLNHMLTCAIAAGAPMQKPAISAGDRDPFAIHSDLAKAYDDFISEATLKPRRLYEWLQPYLNWRWQVRDQFHATSQVKHANEKDRKTLIKFNNSLICDAVAMMNTAANGFWENAYAAAKYAAYAPARKDLATISALEPEAREILKIAQRAKPTPSAFAALFDGYVHDSLAGFDKAECELAGYWRYRRVFLGSDDPVIAATQDGEAARSTA